MLLARAFARPWIIALPCLLGACSTSWPTGSYVGSVSDADAAVLAPAIADYLSGTLPAGSTVNVAAAQVSDPIALVLATDLDRDGIKQAPSGTPVRYVADALTGGIILRVSIADREGASRYFARAENGSLSPNGPLTVMMP